MSPQPNPPAEPRKVRPFYWSVRREIWENRAVYLAPIAVAGVVLLGFLFSTHGLPRAVLRAASSEKAASSLNMPYAAAAAAAFLSAFVVAVFYCLGALHGERRDRSLLFWKSLPVSDLTAVLSKAAVPLLVMPVIILGVAVATQLVMLVLSTVVLLINGIDPGQLWTHLKLPMLWVMLPYGLVLNALWDVPVYAWLLLVSAWAKRMTFVWAVAPPLAIALFEFLAFRTRRVWDLIGYRFSGGFDQAFTVGGKGKAPVGDLSQLDPMAFFANPALWGGLMFGAACLAACVWLRRRGEPI